MRGSRPDENELRGLIGEIYEAAMEAARWPDALARIVRAFGAEHVLFQMRNRRLDGAAPIAMVGFDPSLWRDCGTYWAARDLWALAGKPGVSAPGRCLMYHDVVPDRVLERSEVYNDYLRTRERRLRHVQAAGRFAKAQCLGNGKEVAKAGQVGRTAH